MDSTILSGGAGGSGFVVTFARAQVVDVVSTVTVFRNVSMVEINALAVAKVSLSAGSVSWDCLAESFNSWSTRAPQCSCLVGTFSHRRAASSPIGPSPVCPPRAILILLIFMLLEG